MSTPNTDPTAAPSTQGNTFPCGQCGAQLTWDATKRVMKCPYCAFEQAMPTQGPAEGIREIPIEDGYKNAIRGLGAKVSTICCQDCGATVNVGEGERTAKCAFCGSDKVLPVETDTNAIRPESLVAFAIDKPTANKYFGDWLGDLWFRPNDLKKMAQVQEMGGVYVPFWTFDAHIFSQWSAEAGYYYYETETYTTVEDGNSVTRTRQVQRTRWEPAWGQRQDDYDDTLVCASKGLPTDLVDSFSTFNTKQLVHYAPEYLAGWKAEAYAIDLTAAHATGRQKMATEQERRCGRDVPGDTHRNLNVNNQFSKETFKHVLLPIWIAAYRYDGKVFRFLVNGQTGEVVGKAPWSFWKIFFFTLFCLAIVGTGLYLYNQFKHPTSKSKKKASEDTEEEAPKKKKKKAAADDEDGLRDRAPIYRGYDGRIVVVPV
ncbi:MAG: zinc ribbon domain-containing protein [Polyangiales bacterium]